MHGNIHALNHWVSGQPKRVEQGGVQPHSQGDHYPVIIGQFGNGDHYVQLGGVARRCRRDESDNIAAKAKAVFDTDGFEAAQSLLQQAAI